MRYSYIFEKRFSKAKIINLITLICVLPLFIIGLNYVSYLGIILFFILVVGENVRSPISNHEFHSYVRSERRATLGSILMMSRNIGLAIFLPIFGYLADLISFYNVMLIMSAMMLLNWAFFRIRTYQRA